MNDFTILLLKMDIINFVLCWLTHLGCLGFGVYMGSQFGNAGRDRRIKGLNAANMGLVVVKEDLQKENHRLKQENVELRDELEFVKEAIISTSEKIKKEKDGGKL